jgi:hypothetical protein
MEQSLDSTISELEKQIVEHESRIQQIDQAINGKNQSIQYKQAWLKKKEELSKASGECVIPERLYGLIDEHSDIYYFTIRLTLSPSGKRHKISISRWLIQTQKQDIDYKEFIRSHHDFANILDKNRYYRDIYYCKAALVGYGQEKRIIPIQFLKVNEGNLLERKYQEMLDKDRQITERYKLIDISELERNKKDLAKVIKTLHLNIKNLKEINISVQLEINKDANALLEPKPFYSMWCDNMPLFLFRDKVLDYLCTYRRDDPLEIKSLPVEKVFSGSKLNLLRQYFHLEDGCFVTKTGFVLQGNEENYASAIFQKIMAGKEILPRPDGYRPYTVLKGKDDESKKTKIVYRHWGQTFLSGLSPDYVTQGRLLGSGGSYLAFHFGDKVIVEFDQEDRATYCFSNEYFSTLRAWYRMALIKECPDGYEGRIYHHQGRDVWKRAVTECLK